MKIDLIIVSPLYQNCRILVCEKTQEAIIIDPGYEGARIIERVRKLGVTPRYILATHGHLDHVGAVNEVANGFKIPTYLHPADRDILPDIPQAGDMFDMPDCQIPHIDYDIVDGQEFCFGACQGKAIHTPGHSAGSISFLFENNLFSGDLLFRGSVGRTDLPHGSLDALKQSLRERIFTLPHQITVHPGHGPTTTIGREYGLFSAWVNSKEQLWF